MNVVLLRPLRWLRRSDPPHLTFSRKRAWPCGQRWLWKSAASAPGPVPQGQFTGGCGSCTVSAAGVLGWGLAKRRLGRRTGVASADDRVAGPGNESDAWRSAKAVSVLCAPICTPAAAVAAVAASCLAASPSIDLGPAGPEHHGRSPASRFSPHAQVNCHVVLAWTVLLVATHVAKASPPGPMT